MTFDRVSSRKKVWGKYLEIAQHETPCDFLEGVALLISEHQASSGRVWLS